MHSLYPLLSLALLFLVKSRAASVPSHPSSLVKPADGSQSFGSSPGKGEGSSGPVQSDRRFSPVEVKQDRPSGGVRAPARRDVPIEALSRAYNQLHRDLSGVDPIRQQRLRSRYEALLGDRRQSNKAVAGEKAADSPASAPGSKHDASPSIHEPLNQMSGKQGREPGSSGRPSIRHASETKRLVKRADMVSLRLEHRSHP